MLEQVRFQNYKALRDVTVDLGRFTLLVGPNGCGKSTVLDGIRDLLAVGAEFAEQLKTAGNVRAVSQKLQARLGFEVSASRPGRASPILLGARWTHNAIQVAMSPGEYSDSWDVDVTVDSRTLTAHGLDKNNGAKGITSKENEVQRPEAFLRHAQDAKFRRALRLSLDPAALARPSAASRGGNDFTVSGAGLATYLAGLAARGKAETVVGDLRTVVPQIRSVQPASTELATRETQQLYDGKKVVERARTVQMPAWRLEFEMNNGAVVAAEEVSEGTLLSLGVLAAMHGTGAQVILLDDVDRALHPKAQAELVACIRKILERRPDLQIIATSHSPYLLDLFAPEEVRVMALDANGYAVCKNLADAPNLAHLRKAYQTGEIWAHIWEDWVLDGNA